MEYLPKPVYNILKEKENGTLLVDKYLLAILEKYGSNIKAIFEHFSNQYTYFIKTPIDFMGKDYILVDDMPNNYFRLYHNSKKVSREEIYRILTVRAYCRKVMKPKISVDELLFNVYVDNIRLAVFPLHIGYCANIAEHVYRATEIPEDIKKRINDKIAADRPEICIFKPNTKLEDRKKIMEDIIKEKIARVYDPKLTDRENAENAGVCFNTFKKWAQENGCTKQQRMQADIAYVKEHYDPDMTIKGNYENNEFIADMGISFSTFKNILKKIKQEDKQTEPIIAPCQPETVQDICLPAEQPQSLPDVPETPHIETRTANNHVLNPKIACPTGISGTLAMPKFEFNIDMSMSGIEQPKIKVQTLDDVKKNNKKETENLF